jgi:hypothetical protein
LTYKVNRIRAFCFKNFTMAGQPYFFIFVFWDMAYLRKTWQQKFHNGLPAKVVVTNKRFAGVPAGAALYIATPAIINDYICRIPAGVHTGMQQMRKDLAAGNNAEYTCPVTTGIFLRIVAEAAYEEYMAGKPFGQVTPFWRMIDGRCPVAKKVNFTDLILQQRVKEGLQG